MNTYTAGIIAVSDSAFQGKRGDESGKWIKDTLQAAGYEVQHYAVLPDEQDQIEDELIYCTDHLKTHLIITTGGTGFSKRDVTPEATRAVIEKDAPGVAEAIRAHSMTLTPRAMLSRAVSGIRKDSLIINLPGSPKSVNESLNYILDTLVHGLDILSANATRCARV